MSRKIIVYFLRNKSYTLTQLGKMAENWQSSFFYEFMLPGQSRVFRLAVFLLAWCRSIHTVCHVMYILALEPAAFLALILQLNYYLVVFQIPFLRKMGSFRFIKK